MTNRIQLDTEFASVRWEKIAEKIEFEFDHDDPPFFAAFALQPPNIKRVVISRDEHYRLQGKLYGRGRYDVITAFMRYLHERWNTTKAGTLVMGQTVGFQNGSYNYILVGHFFASESGRDFVVKHEKLDDCIMDYELGFPVHSVEAEYLPAHRPNYVMSKPPCIFVEWCTNAPDNKLGYTLRGTKTISRIEVTTSEDGQARKLYNELHESARDHFRFQFYEFLIRVRFIEISKHASYTRKIAIEYYASTGTLPTVEQRSLVTELLSFLFGRHLLSVGYSLFESLPDDPESDQLIAFRGTPPWRDDLVIASRVSSHPPIDFDPYLIESGIEDEQPVLNTPTPNIEEFIEHFLPAYEKERHDSGLADLLWGLWTAQPQSDNQRLPIYASALETVVKSHLKSRNITLEYLSADQAKTLLREMRKSVGECQKRLELSQTATRGIESKLSNFNNYSANDRMKRFLSMIGLELSTEEQAAMRLRNSSAHGDSSILTEKSLEQEQRVSIAESAYRTLLHRVFLNILGYKGPHVDYGSLGYPTQSEEVSDEATDGNLDTTSS